jgi:hypothetical protein
MRTNKRFKTNNKREFILLRLTKIERIERPKKDVINI